MNALYENDDLLQLTEGFVHPGGELLTRKAIFAAELPKGSKVLDIGCGPGRSVELLRGLGYDARGIDSSQKVVTLANSPYVTLENAQEFMGNYHGLLLQCVLSLIPDKEKFLSHAKSALLPGGRLVLCELFRKQSGENSIPAVSCVNGLLERNDFFSLL